MKAQLSMFSCKARLAVLWIVFGSVIFLLLFLQTVRGYYGDLASDAWGWFLPSIIPPLSLIVSVLVLDALGKGIRTAHADPLMFKVAVGLSCGYLTLVLLTILAQPFAAMAPLELMKQSNLWLGPLQGLVTAALGAFFVK